MTAPTSPAPAPALGLLPVSDPLPLPQPGWGAAEADLAVQEAALAVPSLAGRAVLVRAASTVVLRVGEQAVKVHPPGTDPAHLGRVHGVLRASPVAVAASLDPVVTSYGVVTVTPWHVTRGSADWSEVGRALRDLHDLPSAVALPAWTPLRRLPTQLEHLPRPYAALLADARARLLDRVAALEPVLPLGALHGDVSPENVLRTEQGLRWVDLDFACAGPREYDLSAVVRRYDAGELTDRQYRGFVAAYGADVRGWPGLALLDAVCALSGLGFRSWADRCAGRPSPWLPAELGRLSAVPAAR